MCVMTSPQGERGVLEVPSSGCPRPAGIFPFRLGGQPVDPPCRLLRRRGGQAAAELHRFVPVHGLHRVTAGVVAQHLLHTLYPRLRFRVRQRRLEGRHIHLLLGERAGVHAHHLLVFALRNLIHRQIERPGDLHPMAWTFAGNTRAVSLHALNVPCCLKRPGLLFRRGAHLEFTGRNQRELHADGVGAFHRNAEVSRPDRLMFPGLLSIKWSNGRRRCKGGIRDWGSGIGGRNRARGARR